jgi:hypothetical protein
VVLGLALGWPAVVEGRGLSGAEDSACELGPGAALLEQPAVTASAATARTPLAWYRSRRVRKRVNLRGGQTGLAPPGLAARA